MLKNLNIKNLDPRKKIIKCPYCQQKLRIPIKFGKVLNINCHNCKGMFELNFKNALLELIKWNKNVSFKDNINTMKKTFLSLNKSQKKQLILITICIVYILYIIIR